MCPAIPIEILQNVLYQVVCFTTLVGILLGLAVAGRA
jgi:hypothetical protein